MLLSASGTQAPRPEAHQHAPRSSLHRPTGQQQGACAALSRREVALGLSAAPAALQLLGRAAQAAPLRRSIEEVKAVIQRDFQEGQYYITGRLSPEYFTEDCEFIDPTTNVRGTEFYSKAVASLFDPVASRADLISLKVEDPRHLLLRWRFDASLNLPGPLKPKLKPYTGTTRYYLDDDLRIYKHEETWDISALDAFVSILFPSFGAPPAPPVA